MIKYLPKFIRQLIAMYKELRSQEWGGILYDFTANRNGDLEELARWETDKDLLSAAAIVDNAHDSGRDFVYIEVAKTGNSRGYFMVASSLTTFWVRAFRPGVYESLDAYRDTIKKANKDASKLGFILDSPLDRKLVSE